MSGLGCDRTHGRSGSAQIETNKFQSTLPEGSDRRHQQICGASLRRRVERPHHDTSQVVHLLKIPDFLFVSILMMWYVEGALFYQRTRRRERVELTEELRGTVVAMVQEMHQLFSRGHTPRVKPRKACSACSLKDICLPELLKAKSAEQYIHAYVNEETS